MCFSCKRKNEDGQKPRRKHGCLWTLFICFLVYIGLSVLCGILFGSMMSSSTVLEPTSVYVLRMEGELVEQGPQDDPFGALFSDMPGYNAPQTVGLDDLRSNILLAKEDKNIKGIVLRGGDMLMGQASAKALRDALADFKQSGKFLIAYAENYSQTNYYVASVADKVLLNPVGTIDWNGLSAQKMYFKRLLEKIGVEVQIAKVGTFKSAVEPFIRTSMSEADREQTMLYVSGVWDVMKAGVAESRGLTLQQLDELADRYMGLQEAAMCVQSGLADSLVYVEQLDSLVCRLGGVKEYVTVTTSEMNSVKRIEHKAEKKVAVLYADGEINDSGKEGITTRKMRKQISKIRKDDDIAAVVVRVNSPGGSASASEDIWSALSTLQEKGKKVVVSMGDYAASGGYYISCGADYIFAEPNTLTGSIGIFGMIPSVARLRDKVGVDIDGVTTNRYSDINSNALYKGLNPSELAMVQRMVEHGYDLFTRRCAEGRGMAQDEIKRIGEGRVWLGKEAVKLGLVDELGGIDKAVLKAVDMAELTDYKVVYYPEKKDFLTELLESFESGSTTEEKLMQKIRTLCSRTRIMTWVDLPEIQ